MGAHGLAGGAAGGSGGQAVVRAPLDGRAPELEPLHTPAAIGIGPHSGRRWQGRCRRRGGEGEVGEGCGGGDGDKDDEKREQAAAPSGVGWAAGEGRSWHRCAFFAGQARPPPAARRRRRRGSPSVLVSRLAVDSVDYIDTSALISWLILLPLLL
jgi:hypothetical protein